MLGIDYKRPSSYPVGAVEYLDMTSLDFEEYLWALGVSEAVTAHLRDCFEKCLPVAPPIHDQMMRNLRTYLVTGGMPEAVSIYIERNSMAETDQKLRTILTDYRYDIAHYASADIKLKAEKCYFSLPEQLAKANHKFQYSIVEKGGNARKYGSSVDWLRNVYLTVECRNVTNLEMPLAAHQEMTQFRLYPTDIGLLTSMYDYPFKALLLSSGQQAALQAWGLGHSVHRCRGRGPYLPAPIRLQGLPGELGLRHLSPHHMWTEHALSQRKLSGRHNCFCRTKSSRFTEVLSAERKSTGPQQCQ